MFTAAEARAKMNFSDAAFQKYADDAVADIFERIDAGCKEGIMKIPLLFHDFYRYEKTPIPPVFTGRACIDNRFRSYIINTFTNLEYNIQLVVEPNHSAPWDAPIKYRDYELMISWEPEVKKPEIIKN